MGALLSAPADVARNVDVVVVLGGSGDHGRYMRGRDLVLAGYSSRLVLIEPNPSELKDADEKKVVIEVRNDVVPRNSWGEAMALRELMRAGGLRSVMVVSDPPHMLRLRYIWGSVFRGTGLDYTLVATNPPWWPGWRWWRTPLASNFVGSELLKLGYYVVKYRFGF